MEVLVLDGKNYVKASKAAKDLGYASDYVGQLCRSGQVDSHLIGRTWYVNQEELGTHRFEKKRMSRVKAREQAKKTIEEHRLKVTSGVPNSYKNIDIRYESDTENLIPETRKIKVQSTRAPEVLEEPDYDRTTTILNKGEKIRMSGDLQVVDVTDGPVETDTFVLRPGRIRSGTITVSPREEPVEIAEAEDTDPVVEDEEAQEISPISFSQRLKAMEDSTDEAEELSDADTSTSIRQASEDPISDVSDSKTGVGAYILATVFVFILVMLTLPITKTVSFVPSSQEALISYEFSLAKIIEIISLKI